MVSGPRRHVPPLLQVTFTGNAATSPLGVPATTLGTGVGGAVYVEGATDAFNVTGCRFQRNSAQVGLRLFDQDFEVLANLPCVYGGGEGNPQPGTFILFQICH